MANINYRPTLVVNIFGGPGSGKTTTAWELSERLRKEGFLVEYVSEYAKELTWLQNAPAFSEAQHIAAKDLLDGSPTNQLVLAKEQQRRVEIAIGQVDIVVSDSPTLLGLAYMRDNQTPEQYLNAQTYMLAAQKAVCLGNQDLICSNYNILIHREGGYEQEGRNQTYAEALLKDTLVESLVEKYVPECIALSDTFTLDSAIDEIKEVYTANYRRLGSDALTPYEAEQYRNFEVQYKSAAKILGSEMFFNPISGELLSCYLNNEDPEVIFYDTSLKDLKTVAVRQKEDNLGLTNHEYIGESELLGEPFSYDPSIEYIRAELLNYAVEIAQSPQVWIRCDKPLAEVVKEAEELLEGYESLSKLDCMLMSNEALCDAYMYLGRLNTKYATEDVFMDETKAEKALSNVLAEQRHRGIDCYDYKKINSNVLLHFCERYQNAPIKSDIDAELKVYCAKTAINYTYARREIKRLNDDPLFILEESERRIRQANSLQKTMDGFELLFADHEVEPTLALMLNAAQELDWNIDITEDNCDYEGDFELTFSKASPLGEDYSFWVTGNVNNQVEEIIYGVAEYVHTFDIDAHAAMWINPDGSSKAGYSLGELVEDARDIDLMNKELLDELFHVERICKRTFDAKKKEAVIEERPNPNVSANALLNGLRNTGEQISSSTKQGVWQSIHKPHQGQ